MLNGLDKVNWASLEGAYGPATKVPQMLRSIANATDSKQFQTADEEFVNEINHQGSVYQVTSYTIPFLLELLSQESKTERQEVHLYDLIEFIRAARIEYFWQDPGSSYPPSMYRYELALHDAVCDGLDLYVSLLSNPELKVAGLAMYLLSFLAGQHHRAIPALQGFALHQKNPWVRAATIWGVARMCRDAREAGDRQGYAGWLMKFIEGDADQRVKTVSALAYAQSMLGLHEWPALITDTLINSLIDPSTEDWDAPDRARFFVADFMPFDEDWIHEIGRAGSSALLVQLVRQCNGQPRIMHRLIRELLDVTFRRIQSTLWEEPDWWGESDPVFQTDEQAVIYELPDETSRYASGDTLRGNQKHAPQSIVDCDAFWGLPTNLLSFFFGLPDERDALRDLLA